MATREVKSYVYKNNGSEQEIEGVGLVREGETITIPYEKLDHPDFELIETITSEEEVESEE